MTTREAPILHAVRAALARTGRIMLWRNSTGVDLARGVRYGLGVGSPDLIGATIGDGVMTCFEIKTPAGRLSPEQRMWHAAARNAGIRVFVVRTPDEALAALQTIPRDTPCTS